MSYSSTVLGLSPIAYWRLGEASGTSAADTSGNGHTGTYVGSPTLGVTGLLTGDADTAVTFGTSKYVSTAASAAYDIAHPAVVAWVKGSSFANFQMIVSQADGSSNNHWFLCFTNTGQVRFDTVAFGGSPDNFVDSGTTHVDDNVRHMVVGRYDGSFLDLFVDNVRVAHASISTTQNTGSGIPVFIGAEQGGGFTGTATIDEVAYFDAANLTDTAIANLWAAGGGSTVSLNAALSSETTLAATLNVSPLNTGSLASETALSSTLSLSTLIHAATLQSETALSATLSLYQPLATWVGDDDLRFDSADELGAWLFLEPTEVSPPAGTHVSDLDQVHVTLPAPTLANGVPVAWTPSSVTRSKWGRYQVIVGGVDVTHYRGKRTRVVSYASNEPFGDADATLGFPQITEYDDLSTVPWWKAGAEVTIRRRHPDGTKNVVWEGLLASAEPGRQAHCLGVIYQLDLYVKPRAFLDEPADVGHRIAAVINHRAKHHGFKGGYCTPVDTGIDTREQGVGDPMLTSFIQNILATAMGTGGHQWTLALQHPRQPVVKLKDYTTVHWSVDNGAPGVRPDLVLDYTTADNVEYGSGTSGDCSWENRKFPNLHADTSPLYPLTLPSVFSPGGGTGGFDAFADELRDNGYSMDSDDTYLSSDVDSVEDFQDDAGITVDGVVGPQTWAAAFQTGSNQGDLSGVWVKPLAEDKAVEPWLFNAKGARIGDNPRWDPSKLRIEKMTVFGDRVSKKRGLASAKQMLARDKVPGWVGTITLTSDPAEGSRRDIAAGQNIKLRRWHGSDVLLHIARAEWDDAGQSMALTVDDKARDLMTVAQVYQRNRDVADPVGRPKPGWRTGTQVSDRVQWACEDGAGVIPFHAQFGGLWSVLRIPTGQEGMIAKVNLAAGSGLTRSILHNLLADPVPSGYHGYAVPGASKLAVAVFSREVTANMLANLLGNPLANNGAGNNPWDDNADQLTDWGCQYAAGGPDQAGGFYPHTDPGGGSSTGLTGRFVDPGSWAFESKHIPWLFVGIYAASTCYVGGRLYPAAPS